MKYPIISTLCVLGTIVATLPFASATWITPEETCTLAIATDVTGQKNVPFPKEEGKNILCVKELRQKRIFESISIDITRDQLGGCSSQTLANGAVFNINHPAWKYRISKGDEKYTAVGADNRCGGQFSDYPDKDAIDALWVAETKEYWYDKTNPLCGGTFLFENKDSVNNPKEYHGQWVREANYWIRVACKDDHSGCSNRSIPGMQAFARAQITAAIDWLRGVETVYFSTPVQMQHGAQSVSVSFGDLVGHTTTTSCPINPPLRFDPSKPTITKITDDTHADLTTTATTSYYAGPREWIIDLEDPYVGADQGVSGLKKVSLTVERTHNTYGDLSPRPRVCAHEETYPEKSHDSKDTKEIVFSCDVTTGVQVSGTYNLTIKVEDIAGNTLEHILTFYVAPNKELSRFPGGVPSSVAGVYADNSDNYSYPLAITDKYDNPIWGKTMQVEHTGTGIPLDIEKPNGPSALNIDRQSLGSKTDSL